MAKQANIFLLACLRIPSNNDINPNYYKKENFIMNESIKDILMRRDNLTSDEAQNLIDEAKEAMNEYLDNNDMESAYNVCSEYFGLEPDYLDELI